MARRGVIDVGTNSVKLLVADVLGHVAEPVLETSRQTRLGEGFYASGLLQPEPIARTAEAVKHFADKAHSLGASEVRVIATSAARDASNQTALIQAIRQAADLPLEIISGEQEAEWVFHGVTSNPEFVGQRILIMDLGGGSTEFILGDRRHARFSQSFPLGCVRLLEKLRPSDHPAKADLRHSEEHVRAFLLQNIAPVIEPVLDRSSRETVLVGTGGSATILARMETQMEGFDREAIEAVRFDRAAVRRWVDKLWGLPLADRRSLPGLPANRADVILFGALVYSTVMELLELDQLRVSTRGLRFAAVIKPNPKPVQP